MEGANSHEQPASPPSGELESLISSADGLVETLAAQVFKECLNSIPKEDLIAYGHQGLLEAALRFDASRGVGFRTFAYYRVRGAMVDGLRKMGPWTRRGYERITMLRAANVASADLAQESSEAEALSGQEAAERLRKHMASMVTAMTTGIFCGGGWQRSNSQTQISSDEPSSNVAVDDSSNAEEQLAELELHQLVNTTVAELPPPEDEVVRRFYVEGDNMDAIAQDMGRSRSWVSRVHTRALTRLGARLRHESISR